MLFWILLAALLALIARPWIKTARARKAYTQDRWTSRPDWETATWTTVMLGIFGPIVLLFGFGITSMAAGTPTLDSTTALAALRTSSEVEGRFFLGSGTVDEKAVIRYIERQTDGAATLESIDARYARIYEDEATEPYVEVYCRTLENPWIFPARINMGAACIYNFHVPAGSVLESYEVAP